MSIDQVRCAAILAGGKSSRMGQEKALIEWEGQPLIQRVADVLRPIFPHICVVTSNQKVADAAGLLAIEDQYADKGPLGGIHAALQHFQAPTFIVACDMPFLCGGFIQYLTQNFEGDALVPESPEGIEPLHAIYGFSCAAHFQNYLQGGDKVPSLRRVLNDLDTRFVSIETVHKFDPTLRCFSNWNTPEDVSHARSGA